MQKLIFSFSLCFVISFCAISSAFEANSPLVRDWMRQDGRTEVADAAYIKKNTDRRNERLKTLKEKFPKIVFTKHFDLGGSHYAYTEAQSDAQNERDYRPGSALCLLELAESGEYKLKTLLTDPHGVIRDPAVTFDGKKIIFSWKKSDRLDDYHLYDYDVATAEVRQLTFGLGFADYEPCPLPNGDIIFNSTRCVQVVDCWWTEVSNLYICNKDGEFVRRLSYDQVHTNYPTLMDDGRVIYTRWDYNDRGQIFPQGLFQMFADGTGQTEFYGNNSWFPTTLMHTRAIPDSGGKVVSIFSGHHNRQYGKLGIVDTSKGRQENSGTQLIAPITETKADRIDAWGQWGDRFSHPYPINEKEFIVSYNDEFLGVDRSVNQHTTRTPFGIYWVNEEGERELLACDPRLSCNQPVPLIARKPVPIRASVANSDSNFGTYTMEDVYFGPGLEGVERGAAKTLRVIGIEFRSTGIGSNTNHGPSGGALVSTPVSTSNGTWDVKIPLGDVPINEDGSASFKVPARTPVYFQILDENGHCIQTMRSWSTLQPGETFSCVGCHEDKNSMEHPNRTSVATRMGPQDLKPFYGEPRGFSFAKEIQPILDKNCVQCHNDENLAPPYMSPGRSAGLAQLEITPDQAAKLIDKPIMKTGASWHYTTEKPMANWTKPEFFAKAAEFPNGDGGFGTMPGQGFKTPWDGQELWTWTTIELPENWESQRLILQHFHDENLEIYVNGQRLFTEPGHNSNYSYVIIERRRAGLFKPGLNFIAAHVTDTGGGRGFDMGLFTAKNDLAQNQAAPVNLVNSDKPAAFSLKGDPVLDEQAKRYWSRSYLNLTNATAKRPNNPYLSRQNKLVNWINVQESPEMLPAYKAGATKSELLNMFDPNISGDGSTHNDIKLTREDLDKIACWIDLLIPFCGDYFEANAWDEHEKAKFAYYEAKKAEMDQLSLDNAAQYVNFTEGKKAVSESTDRSNPYRNLLTEAKEENGWKHLKFEKPVRIDQIAVTLGEDGVEWKECMIECSNGFRRNIVLRDTADRQVFTFHPQTVEWVKFVDFKPATAPKLPAKLEIRGINSTPRTYIAPGTEER